MIICLSTDFAYKNMDLSNTVTIIVRSVSQVMKMRLHIQCQDRLWVSKDFKL